MAYGNGGSYGSETATINYPTATAPPREPMVLREAERLAKATEGLHSLISELEQRLAGVLSPEPPSKDNAGVAPTMPVPLAQHIGSSADRIGYACARLQ